MSRDQSTILPEKIQFVFRTRRCSGTVSDTISPFYTHDVTFADLTPSDGYVSIDLTGFTGTFLPIRDSAVALKNGGNGDPTNKTALDDLAKQWAQDYLDWVTADAPGDLKYVGIVAPEPSGLIDTIEWTYTAEMVATRVTGSPFTGFMPEELQHFDPATANCTDLNNPTGSGKPIGFTPALDYYSPPESCIGGGAKATATVDSGGHVTNSFSITAGGTYTGTPTVAFSDDGVGSGATATATVSGGAVTSVTLGSGGSKYSSANPPIVSFNGGGAKLQRTRMRLSIETGRLVTRFIAYETIG